MSKKSHLTIEDRNAILIGIQNGGALVNIAKTLGKDPTTIKKEIIKHREISYRSQLPVECSNYQNCSILKKHSYKCNEHCQYYKSIFVKDAIELLALVMDAKALNLAALQNINIILLMFKWNIP